jgi:hypothetical protein
MPISRRLYYQIADSIDVVDSSRLHYVDVNASGSPFEGHTVCSDPEESKPSVLRVAHKAVQDWGLLHALLMLVESLPEVYNQSHYD